LLAQVYDKIRLTICRFPVLKRKTAGFFYICVFACLLLSELTDFQETWQEHFAIRKRPNVFVFPFNKKKKTIKYGGSAKY
jgi:hypothetical protein